MSDRLHRLLSVSLIEPRRKERPGLTFFLAALVIAATAFGLLLGEIVP